MKATLSFNFDDIEDEKNFTIYNNAKNYLRALEEIDSYLRYHYKHSELSTDVLNEVDKIREKLFDILSEYNVDL